jgi:DNA-binding MarR family transcriptional regulator
MQPAEEIRYLILATQREGNRTLVEALRPLGITPSQAEALRILQEFQPLSLVELGELLVCEAGSPSRLVAGLVGAGLVERTTSTADARKVTLMVTKKGQEIASQITLVEAHLYDLINPILQDVSIEDIIATLWRLVEDRPAGKALARRIGRKQHLL